MAQQRAPVANFQDLQKATIEQWFWIADIADRISELKSYSVDGFTGFWASVFYFFSALGIWMLTGIRRTEKARVWLVVLLGAFAVLEYGLQQKLLADVESEPDGMPDARFISQFLHEEALIMRHIFAVSSVGVLAYFFYSYEDQILSIRLEIGEMMKELQDLRGVIATRGGTRKIVDGATGLAEACFSMVLMLANFPGAEALETSNCAGLTAAVVVLAVFLCGAVLALAVINNWKKLKDEVRRLKSADAGLIPNPIFSGTLSSTAEENEKLRDVPDDELPLAVSVPPAAPANLAAPLMPNTSQQARQGRRLGSRLPKRRGRHFGRPFHGRREGCFSGPKDDLGVDFQKFEPS